MRERPILFSAPMVRAILAGQKTQTRRIVKPQPDIAQAGPISGMGICAVRTPNDQHLGRLGKVIPCAYGQPGDCLWVRESFSGPWCMEAQDGCAAAPPSKWGRSSPIWYWADGNPDEGDWTKPRPSIHMPRWASRITLEIVSVRVQRLQDIKDADAQAEGVEGHYIEDGWYWRNYMLSDADAAVSPMLTSAKDSFYTLWKSINGAESWAANPWVWAVEFRRITQ